MISRDLTLRINNNTATLSEPVTVYMHDRNIKLNITIENFKFRSEGIGSINGININTRKEEIQAAMILVKSPDGKVYKYLNTDIKYGVDSSGNIIKDAQGNPISCLVSIIIPREWTDESIELGKYYIQIQIIDKDESTGNLTDSKVTLPPFFITIAKPLFPYNDDNNSGSVGDMTPDSGFVGSDTDVKDESNLVNGFYDKTNWVNGSLISSAALNKIEKRLGEIYSGDGFRKTLINDYNTNAKTTVGAVNELKSLLGVLKKELDDYIVSTPSEPPKPQEIHIESIEFTSSTLEMSVNKTYLLTYSVTPKNYTDTIFWVSGDETIATVKNGLVTAKKAGTVTISCYSSYEADPKMASVVITIKDPSAVVVPVTKVSISSSGVNQLKVGQRIELTKTVIPPNYNETLHWIVDPPGIIKVVSEGNKDYIEAIGVGENAIVKCQSDNGVVSNELTFNVVESVPIDSVEFNLSELVGVYRGRDELTYKLSPSNHSDKLIWEIGNDEIIQILDLGNNKLSVSYKNIGDTDIIFKSSASGKTLYTMKVYVLEDAVDISSITIKPGALSCKNAKDQFYTLTCDISPSDATIKSIKWTSDDDSIAEIVEQDDVNRTCKIKINGYGETFIKVVANGDENNKVTCRVNSILHIPLDSIELVHEPTMLKGTESEMKYILHPENTTETFVQFSSSNNSIIEIDQATGKMIAHKGGNANITVTGGNSIDNPKSVSMSIKSIAYIEDINLPSSLNLVKGENLAVSLSFEPLDATERIVEWEIQDPSLLSISGNNIGSTLNFIPKEGGNTRVTCILNPGTDYEISKSMEVNIGVPISNITVSGPTTVEVNKIYSSYTKTLYPNDTTQTNVVWSVSDPTKATIDRLTGQLHVIGSGPFDVICTSTEKPGVSGKISVNAVIYVEEITLSVTEEIRLFRNTTKNLPSYTIKPYNATDQTVSWVSSDPSIISIDISTNKITAHKKGSVDLICIAMDRGIKQAICKVRAYAEIKGVDILANGSKADDKLSLCYGEPLKLSAAVVPTDTDYTIFDWYFDGIKVRENISFDSEVIYNTEKLVSNSRIQCVNVNYPDTISDSLELEIIPGTISLAGKLPNRVDKGQIYKLSAKTLPLDYEVIWSSSNPDVATVDETGRVEIKADSGEFTITCSLAHAPSVQDTTSATINIYPTSITIENSDNQLLGLFNGRSEEFVVNFNVEPSNYNVPLILYIRPDSALNIGSWDSQFIEDEGKIKVVFKTEEHYKIQIMFELFDGTYSDIKGILDVTTKNYDVVFKSRGSKSLTVNRNNVVDEVLTLSEDNGIYTYALLKPINFELESIAFSVYENGDYHANTDLVEVPYLQTKNLKSLVAAFDGCSSLSTIDVSYWNTENVTSTINAFSKCTSLTNIYGLECWDTRNMEEMRGMFDYCHNLESVNMSGWDVSNVVTMAGLFSNCKSLTDIIGISDWNTSKLENLTYPLAIFYHCESLTSLNLSKWDVSNVTDMDSMFYYCSSLESVNMSGWDVSNVTDMRGMFGYCHNLESVNMSGWDVSNVTDMDSMFRGCLRLKSLELLDWDVSNVTDMSNMFCDCKSLESLYLFDLELNSDVNTESLFYSCYSLVSIDCNKAETINKLIEPLVDRSHNISGIITTERHPCHIDTASLLSKNWQLLSSNKGALQQITISSTEFEFDIVEPGTTFTISYETVPSIYSPEYDDEIEIIYDERYLSRDGDTFTVLETLEFDTIMDLSVTYKSCSNEGVSDSVEFKAFKPTDYYVEYAVDRFDASPLSGSNLPEITYIDGDNFNANDYRLVRLELYNNSITDDLSVPTIDIRKIKIWYPENTTMIKFRDSEISSLSYLKTDNVTDMSNMFNGCQALLNVDTGNWNTENVTDMCGIFNGCLRLKSLELLDWNVSNVTNMSSMFNGCEALLNVDTGNWNTENVTDMSNMFSSCKELLSINVNDWNVENVVFASDMFNGCEKLQLINGLSSWSFDNVITIERMFADCKSLNSLEVFTTTEKLINVTSVFENCTTLISLNGISNWNVSSITSTERLFFGCESLASIDLSGWDTKNVRSFNYTFYNCASLEELNILNWDMSRIDSSNDFIVNANNLSIIKCNNSRTIKLIANQLPTRSTLRPGAIETSCEPIDFYEIISYLTSKYWMIDSSAEGYIKSISIVSTLDDPLNAYNGTVFEVVPIVNPEDYSKDQIEYIFDNNVLRMNPDGTFEILNDIEMTTTTIICRSKYNPLIISNEIRINNLSEYYVEYTVDNSRSIPLNTRISSNIAYGLPTTNYKKVEITLLDDSKVDNPEVTSDRVAKVRLWYAKDTTSLRFNDNIDYNSFTPLVKSVGYFKTDNFRTLSMMFAGCASLELVDTTTWNVDKAFSASPGSALYATFYGCTSLKTFSAPTWNTSNLRDGSMTYLFSQCINLSELNIENWYIESTALGEPANSSSAVYACSNLKNIKCNSLTSIKSLADHLPSYPIGTYGIIETIHSKKDLDQITDFTLTYKHWKINDIKISSIEITGDASSINVGETCTLSANILPDNYSENYIWCCDEDTIHLGSDGIIEAKKPGDATVYIKTEETGLRSNDYHLNITGYIREIAIFGSLTDVEVGSSIQLVPVIYPSVYDESYSWVSTDESVATVDSNGYVRIIGPGKCSIYACTESGITSNFIECIAHRYIDSMTVSGNIEYLNVGDQNRLTVTVNPVDASEQYEWISSDESVATVDFVGNVRAVGIGNCEVYTRSKLKGRISNKYSLNVHNYIQSMSMISVQSRDVYVGTTFNVGVLTTPRDYCEHDYYTFSSSDTNIATVDQNGEVNVLKEGNFTITAISHKYGKVCSKEFESFNKFSITMASLYYPTLYINGNIISSTEITKLDNSQYCYHAKAKDVKSFRVNDPDLALVTVENGYNITSLKNAFSGCSGLVHISLDMLYETNKITNMQAMFSGCTSLSHLDTVLWKTDSVNDMSNMFYGCSSLEELDLHTWNTSNVTSIRYMFTDCSSLESVDLSNLDFSKVTDMSQLFKNCSKLKTLTTSGWKTDSVNNMSSMFYDCTLLQTLDASGWNVGSVNDMSYMFYNCSILEFLNVYNWDVSKVNNMSSMFCKCNSMSPKPLEIRNISKWNTCCVTDMSAMFKDCSHMVSLDMSGWDTGSVTDMTSMFANCTYLQSVNISNWDTVGVKSMKYLFFECGNLTTYMPPELFWKREPSISHFDAKGCFTSCYKIPNYSDIPNNLWRDII